jgi:MOSC domain-containing protein YiiM
LCRVVKSGRIRRGDRVEIEDGARATHLSSDDSLSGTH